MYFVYFGVLLFSLAVVVKMFNTQLTVGVEDNAISAISKVKIKASRGNIFADDVEKSALAISVPQYEIRMDLVSPSDKTFDQGVDSLGVVLSSVLGKKTAREYAGILTQGRKNKNAYFLLAKGVSFNDMKKIKSAPILRKGQFRGGRIILKQNKRRNPFGLLAERTVGYLSATDTVVGLEGAYNKYLAGTDGLQYMKRVGGKYKIPVSDDYLIEPQDGKDVYTTIDVNVQDVAEKSLLRQLQIQDAEHGCAIVMEVKTGKIKAIANLSKKRNGKYGETYNHAVGRATEPGSTFKLASLMVALEDGKTSLSELYNTFDGTIKYYDRTMKDSHLGGDGIIPLSKGFALSSNVVVSQVINNGYKKTPSKFIEGVRNLGLGKELGVEIKGEGSPYVKNRKDSTWSGVTLPWMSIGYETQFTPLQILTFYNAVANDGRMVKPQFVKEIRDGVRVVEEFETEVLKERICSEKTILAARKMLELVVEEGTGKNLQNAQYKIAGKTGTTQLAYGTSGYGQNSKVRHQASFCGYFPADNPKYSCIVVVAAPSKSIYGNVVSGTVFKEIADRVYALDQEMARPKDVLLAKKMPASKSGYTSDLDKLFKALDVSVKYQNVGSTWGETNAQNKKVILKKYSAGAVPNVKGMGLRDALNVLENKGYRVKVKGSGVVSEQKMLNPNSKIMEIILV